MSPSSKATSIIDGDVEKGSKTKGGLGVSAKDVRAAAVSHDVFVAEEGGEGPDFRGVGSAGATVLLLKTQFGLGGAWRSLCQIQGEEEKVQTTQSGQMTCRALCPSSPPR